MLLGAGEPFSVRGVTYGYAAPEAVASYEYDSDSEDEDSDNDEGSVGEKVSVPMMEGCGADIFSVGAILHELLCGTPKKDELFRNMVSLMVDLYHCSCVNCVLAVF